MQANRLPATRGWIWIIEGLRLIRRAPMSVASATSTMIMLLTLVWIVPLLGQVAFYLMTPLLEIGMFLIFRSAAMQEFIRPTSLFVGFRMRLAPLFTLGGIRMINDLVIAIIAVRLSGLDAAQLSATFNTLTAKSQQPILIPDALIREVMSTMVWMAILRIPITLATWFAAPCVSLRGIPLTKALFFSWVACWRNLGALVVFAISYGVVGFVLPSFALSLLSSVWPPLALPGFVLWSLLAVALLHAGFYRSAVDVFGEWPHPWTHEI